VGGKQCTVRPTEKNAVADEKKDSRPHQLLEEEKPNGHEGKRKVTTTQK